jgi:hypothetical protein
MADFNENLLIDGLGTTTFLVPNDGIYSVSGKMTLPTLITAGVQSQLVVTVNQNGTPVYVGPSGAEGFYVDVDCVAGDVLTVVLSSALPSDQQLNTIQGSISISQGE